MSLFKLMVVMLMGLSFGCHFPPGTTHVRPDPLESMLIPWGSYQVTPYEKERIPFSLDELDMPLQEEEKNPFNIQIQEIKVAETNYYEEFDTYNYTHPDILTEEQIRAHLLKYFSVFDRCDPQSGDRVSIRIFMNGHTGSIAFTKILSKNAGTPIARCVASVLPIIKFRKFKREWLSVDCLFKW